MSKVIIIGSGIVGSTIAYELSHDPSLDITLIDEKNPGTGSTGAALGILMAVISHKTKGRAWKLRESSLQRYNTLIPELETLTGLQIPYNTDGIVKLLFPDDDLNPWENLVEIRSQQGYTLDIWDKSLLKHYCPEVDVSSFLGAVYSPCDRQINPTFLTKALVKGASLKGVKCIFGEKVRNLKIIEDKSKRCQEITIGNDSLSADWVILATGLGTSSLIQPLGSKIAIKPVLGQALLLKHTEWKTKENFNPVITGNDIHIAPMGNDEFWLGATVEFPSNGDEILPDEELLQNLQKEATRFFPSLVNTPIMLSWTGKRPRPEGKSAPIIEKLEDYENIILATGHYRNGVLLAPATALSVLELIKESP
ncbi:D-amino acid dehydrogenase small subunit [Geminocystis sp. NIES-3708]|uniref:NAD(P)/FAD-dependent oxidoreductase n=1 Tax=Geminocystis sp. NIES-3708 TaxID=1615909 RepID=UPI0005FC3A69|nr:FAD-dependent oxidoreductase [Geminocystis sp. NIES-3708]BAQ61975.1 D-amino acid dehydrogenase small subunit [Geminocystis sp. NIES-3708]